LNDSLSKNDFTIDRMWVILTLELLLVGMSRMIVLHGIRMGGDEIWSVWQTLGTPGQIIQWTPYDWTPGYYLTLGLWRGFVGMLPFALRMLSVLMLLVGCAALYRVARRLGGRRAALLAMPAYGALGYIGVLVIDPVNACGNQAEWDSLFGRTFHKDCKS
jgi:hypothetical protein